jgi:myosin protein heavy chain
LQKSRIDFNNLEDAVLVIESEKADWVKRMESTAQQLVEESAKRQHFEQQVYDNQVELAKHRNTALAAERERAKAAGDIKARDDEIALLRSRENKTIVEHVHVLEQAKKMTDRQLVEQIRENTRLNTQMKSMETHRNRVVGDLEDLTRQFELLKAGKSRDARNARASLSHEDKDVEVKLEEEKRKRVIAEARVDALERDLQDQRKKLSTNIASPGRSNAVETRLAIKTEELSRMETSYKIAQAQNAKLQAQVDALNKAAASKSMPFPQTPATPSRSDAARAEMLRGLQQSHDQLGRDMSDQLRKLDSAPLTPSRRQNSSFSNGHGKGMDSPDLVQAAKRTRQLETEINGLRQQLEDEREEKEFCYERIRDLQGDDGPKGKDGKPFPFEQAMFSHFRLKAKSLRSQLDQ